jgi:hypothetical protein
MSFINWRNFTMKIKQPQIVTKESLQQMIDEACFKRQQHIIGHALVAIFERQTQSEQCADITEENNGVGFAGCDAEGGSKTAKSYLKRKALVQWQVEKWTRISPTTGFSRICKYAGQLNQIAIEKAKQQLKLEGV